MKKIFSVILIALMLLGLTCSCAPERAGGGTSHIIGNSSDVGQEDKELSAEANDPIAAYEQYVRDMEPPYDYASYGFRDMNSDGIPELLIWENFHLFINTYKDGKVKEFYTPGHNAMNGPVTILDHNAIFIKHVSTGTIYTYTTFEKDSTVNSVEFSCANVSQYEVEYRFEGKTVTKKEWDKLTKKYFEYSEMPEAQIEWKATLGSEYTQAKEAYRQDEKNHRDIGEFQKETEQILNLEGRYFQSYVDEAEDKRYVYLSFHEYEMAKGWDWVCIGTAENYSLTSLNKEN